MAKIIKEKFRDNEKRSCCDKHETINILGQACSRLNKEFSEKRVTIVSLSEYAIRRDCEADKIIDFTLDDKTSKGIFTTYNYVGFYTTRINGYDVSITINPRFGEAVQNRLFSHALDLYLPKGESQKINDRHNNLWLIALMWKVNLEKALTKSQIPKIYNRTETNQRYFRGRLKVNEHIRHNFIDENRFYCSYSKFSFNSPINRAIRYTYRILMKEGYKNIIKGLSEHDQMLADFGVSNEPMSVHDIDSIRYSPLNISYKPIMQICRSIISFKSYKNNPDDNNTNNFAVFLDMSEVWENYLYHLLQRQLNEYEVVNPNLIGGDYLFEGDKRKVRPDILIKKDGRIVAIIDAKYKWYRKIGNSSAESDAVSREDLYQMVTYLCRFGAMEDVIGLFVSPCSDEDEQPLTIKRSRQRIGVLGLNIDVHAKGLDEKKEIEEAMIRKIVGNENKFIEKLNKLLNNDI